MAGGSSYNGWPASDDPDAIDIDPGFRAGGIAFPGGARSGDVATVLGYVIEQFWSRVEAPLLDPDTGQPGYGCWGWNYRANVNNPSTLSCHSSGTAVDVSAPAHPNGASGTFTEAQRATIYDILAEVGGAVQWGGDYTGTKDEMHFEIIVDAGYLAQVAAGLTGGAAPEPEPPAVPTITEVGMYIVFGPGGAKLCGPGYEKNLDGEEYDALMTVPGMQMIEVDQRGFDVHGAAMTNGHSANDIART